MSIAEVPVKRSVTINYINYRATIDVSMYCKLLIMEYAFVYLLKCNHISQIKNIQTDKRVFTVKCW